MNIAEKKTERLFEKWQSLDRVFEEYAKSKNLNYISLSVLEAIYEMPEECTQKLICELIHYPKQSVNLVIKSFWESGYVELRETPEDRRNKLIILTEKGKMYAEEIIAPLEKLDNFVIEKMGERQFSELMRLMDIYGQLYLDEMKKLLPTGVKTI